MQPEPTRHLEGSTQLEPFVDTHAHLSDIQFDVDREIVVERAVDHGVRGILAVSVDLASSRFNVQTARNNPRIACAVGIHPSECGWFEVQAASVKSLLAEPEVRAVGEIGLDYKRFPELRDLQLEAFRAQTTWAVDAGLPVVVHDRDAHDDVIATLDELRPRGVLHCFSGDAALVAEAVRLGMYVSFAGNVTYKNAGNLHAAARAVPASLLLIETDSPYLPPEPLRGRRNEPANVTLVAKRIAELRGTTVEEIARQTTLNATALFGVAEWGE